ncbi:hypothetical protein N9C96_01765 [bacterium]|nr:hypothetical protein [bacterium]
MKRLITSGLMFGNLIHISSPALVERYNRALKHLTGKETTLTDFHIDISGFSPEIGHELGDPLYLNHAGANRQFILLTTNQKQAPLLDAKFSTSRGILHQFIEDNQNALFSLTSRDAVAGELVNSIFDMDVPSRLFDIRQIVIEADTTRGAVQQSEKLDRKVDVFLNENDAWFDDVLIAEMIDLARQTGDVVRNPIKLKKMVFEQRNFWTAHFGGVFLFQDVEHPALISTEDKSAFQNLPIRYAFDLNDRRQIAKFLELNGLVETITDARGIDASAILRQKMDFMLVDAFANEGVTFEGRSPTTMRRLAREHANKLPAAFHSLSALLNWAEHGAPAPKITPDDPAYFYALRSADHKDAFLVNMLLAELSTMDIRQLFICHKHLFYKTYSEWPDAKKDFVVDFLTHEYTVDKMAAREALFGHEAPMEETTVRVGPWGAVRG